MRFVSLLFVSLVSGCAAQPQAVSQPPKAAVPAQARLLPAPPANATDSDVSDFFTTCSSTHVDSSIGSRGLTGKDDENQMKMAGYYMVVAQSYAPKEQTDKKWSELRGVSKARFTEATAGPNVFAGMTIILSDVQAQMIECSNYVRNNKAAVEARVTQSGALK